MFKSGPDSNPKKLFHSDPGFGPRKIVYHSGLEKMASKHKYVNSNGGLQKDPKKTYTIKSPGPQKINRFGPLIRAPKSCSIRVPDSDAPKQMVASKEPLEKHAQPRVRASKNCSIPTLIRALKRCSIRILDSGPEKSYTIRIPDLGPEKLFHLGFGFKL